MRLGNRKLVTYRRKTQKSFAPLILLFVLIATICYMLIVVRPTFMALAENKAKELAITVIHRVVSESLRQNAPDYGDIVVLERNDANSVTAVKSNLATIGTLKSDLNLSVMEAISSIDSTTLKIPLGSLLGSDLFAGTGPAVSFRVKPYGTAETDILTDFTEAGINQTMLDVTVAVKADLSILIPTIHKKSTVETTVPVLQTVIVGNVPESYTHVDRDGYDFEDDVLELAE